jgi:hypothetical protein
MEEWENSPKEAARRVSVLTDALLESRTAMFTAGDLLNAMILCFG